MRPRSGPTTGCDRGAVPDALRHVALVAGWLVLLRFAPAALVAHAPGWARAHLSFAAYLGATQACCIALGIIASLLLLRVPRDELGLVRVERRAALSIALVAPAIFVASTLVAVEIATPTLLAEVARRGASVSRENAATVGRVVTQGPWLVTLFVGAVLAATNEELFFRGALWSLLRTATARLGRRDRNSFADALRGGALRQRLVELLVDGGVATLVSAAVFAWMHADVPGGVGIVRVVSAACLGVGCGVLRHWSGSVLAPMLLHFTNNALAIGNARGWFSAASWPVVHGVPTLLWLPSALLALVALALAVARRRRMTTM